MKHLKIEQNSNSETVSLATIENLYQQAKNGTLDSTSNLKGSIYCANVYQDAVDYLTTKFPDLEIKYVNTYIRFEDKVIENLIVKKYGDGVGITSLQVAAIIGNLDISFSKASITKFNELGKYFQNVNTINGWQFDSSTIEEIDLSNIVTLNVQAFSNCKYLKKVTLTSKFTTVTNWYGAFLGCTSLEDTSDISGLTEIFPDQYNNCTSLKYAHISNICKKISNNAFYGCKALLDIGDTSAITELGNNSFLNCQSLVTINFPSIVTLSTNSSQDGCFRDCTSLKYVTLGSALTIVGTSCFYNCTALIWIKIQAITPPTLSNIDALSTSNNCPIYVPDDSVAAYQAATNWSTYSSRIKALSTFSTDFPNG